MITRSRFDPGETMVPRPCGMQESSAWDRGSTATERLGASAAAAPAPKAHYLLRGRPQQCAVVEFQRKKRMAVTGSLDWWMTEILYDAAFAA